MVKKSRNTALRPKSDTPFSTKEYAQTLADLKQRIRSAQVKAALAANSELLLLYWDLGKTIIERQKVYGWGSKFVEVLANDLQNEFPGMEGFSRTNVFRTRAFYLAY